MTNPQFPTDLQILPDITDLDPRFGALLSGQFRLVSFDLFNTLFIRTHHRPEELFTTVGEMARARGVLDSGLTPTLFKAMRLHAARLAEEKYGSERTTLRQIYGEMPKGIIQTEAVIAIELEVEATAIRPNRLLAGLPLRLRAQGVRVVVLSDTYLERDQLVWLMEQVGIAPNWFDTIYASCDAATTKRTGGLFARLIADHPAIPTAAMCHIGDDPLSDVVAAQRAGLATIDYRLSGTFLAMLEREAAVLGQRGGRIRHDQARCLAARLPVATEEGSRGFWYSLGALVFGPVLVRYGLWVADECERLGIRRIVVLMREGRLLAPIIQSCAARRGYNMTVTALPISRQAINRTRAPEWDRKALHDLLEKRPHLRLRDLFTQVDGIAPPDDLLPFADNHMEELSSRFLADGQSILDHTISWFNEPAVAAVLADNATHNQTLTVAWLEQEFADADHVALVDLGSRATTAAAIHRLDPIRAKYRLRGFLLYATEPVVDVISGGLPVSVEAGLDANALDDGKVLYRSPFVIERLLTGADDCTIGYRQNDDGRVMPVFGSTAAKGEELAAIHAVENGINGYWTCHVAIGLPAPEDQPSAAFALWLALIQLPTIQEAEHLGSLRYDYNDGSDWVREICDSKAVETVRPLLAENAGPLQARLFGSRPQQVPWPQGAATRLDPYAIRRHFDALSFNPGHRAFCATMARRIRKAGVKQALVFAAGGTGGMGEAFITEAGNAGLEVVGYLDHMPHMVEGIDCGVPVLRPEQLAADSRYRQMPVAIVSLGYQDKIVQTIRRHSPENTRILYGLFVDPVL